MHRARHPSDFLHYLSDRLVASDPALERLQSGLRAVLTAGVCAGAFLLLTRLLGLKYEYALGGIVVPMIAAAALPDAGRRQQQVTMAWVPVVASAMLVLGSLVGDNPWLSGGCFLLVLFAAFEVRRFGPRATGLGTIAYQSFFYALLLKVPPSKAQWDPLFVFAGCAIAFGIRFWLVPEHPGRMLRSELRAWRARIAALLHDMERGLERGDGAGAKTVDAHLAALNAQSLGLESRLVDFACEPEGGIAADLRVQVLQGELATETVAAAVRAAAGAGAPDRRRLAAGLRALEDGIHQDRPSNAAGRPVHEYGAEALPDALGWRLHRAFEALAGLPSLRQALPAMRDERKSAPAAAPSGDKDKRGPDDITRRALQACTAALGALLAGRALSPDHWFWAVFAAFVVFTRAVTVGQTLSSAWRQVLATVGGLCVGVAAAELVHGSRSIELSLLFVFIAAGFYAFHGMQNTYTVLLSAMLAMLYELMGMDSPGLLLLRLEETAIGAASAILSARFIFPTHTRDESGSRSAALLRAASKLLRAAWTDADADADTDSGARHAAVRELDRKLQALRQSLGPVTGASYPGSKENRRQHLARLARIAYCVRHCCHLAIRDAPGLTQSAPLAEAAGTLARRLDAMAALLATPAQRGRPNQAPPALALPAVDENSAMPLRLAVGWLAETDQTLRAIGDELPAPGKP
jgi:uncharacterized membrane protein YccC